MDEWSRNLIEPQEDLVELELDGAGSVGPEASGELVRARRLGAVIAAAAGSVPGARFRVVDLGGWFGGTDG